MGHVRTSSLGSSDDDKVFGGRDKIDVADGDDDNVNCGGDRDEAEADEGDDNCENLDFV